MYQTNRKYQPEIDNVSTEKKDADIKPVPSNSESEDSSSVQTQESAQQPKRAPLFLEAAVQAQNERLEGNVFLLRPLGHTIFASFFIIVILAIVSFVSFGSYTKKVTVAGSLKPTEGAAKVYADSTGIISDIFVNTGEIVKKGQPLVRLSREQFMTSMENTNELAVEQLKARIASLESQLEGLTERYSLEEKQLLIQRANTQESVESLSLQLSLMKEKHSIKLSRFSNMSELADKNYISALEMEQLRGDLFDAEVQIKQVESSLMDRRHALSDIDVKLNKLPSQKLFEAEQIHQQIAQHRQVLVDTHAGRENIIVAPADGRVVTILAEKGNAVFSSMPLMTLVPEASAMEAEVFVPASAISFIKHGQEVRLQYQAIPVQRYGTFPGTVKYISETAINPGELNGPFKADIPVYRLLVEIQDQKIQLQNQLFTLVPGMVVGVDLLGEKQTILEWLLEPVWDVKERF